MARTKVAINGFGRIGRQVYRILHEKFPDLNVVLINDLTDGNMLAHLLEFDTSYGQFTSGDISFEHDYLKCGKEKARVTSIKDPSELPHKELKVDVVLECTGHFRTRESAAAHLVAGAKKVIMSAPAKDQVDGTFCMGVNDEQYDSDTMDIISNASCTTNCLAPLAKTLHEAFGIEHGLMTTVHSYTNDQNLLDLPHKDYRRARAAAENIVPTSTGAAKAIGLVVPELDGKLNGSAIRVPTPTGSIVDLTVVTSKPVTEESVNEAYKKASEKIPTILGYEERPLVLKDYVGDSRSCIFDAELTQVIGDNMVKVFGWYDNEWGYSTRLAELTNMVAEKL